MESADAVEDVARLPRRTSKELHKPDVWLLTMDMHTMFSTWLSNIKIDQRERLYNAVITDDASEIYRVGNEIFETSNCFYIDSFMNMVITDRPRKSSENSDQFRNKGNAYYEKSDYKMALWFYNKALAVAPKNSLQMQLAYSNISAVTNAIKAFKDCLANIDVCLAMNCRKDIQIKLEKRKNVARKFIDESSRGDQDQSMDYINQLLKFEWKRNEEVPCAHEDVIVQEVDGQKLVIAGKDITSGSVVATERAFMSCHTEDQYLKCYYCHAMRLFFIPCDGCDVLFCTKECKTNCMKEYHRIECQIIKYLESLYESASVKLVTRAAIKMSLKMGWDEFIKASGEMGAKRLHKASAQEAFDSTNPLSVLSYKNNEGPHRDKLYHGSLIFAVIVDALTYVKNYIPRDEAALIALGSVMINLYAKFTRTIEISTPAYDLKKGEDINRASRNVGIFSFTSKLKHSCEPNLLVFGMNDSLILVAVKKIKKGEELTISYIDHFEDIYLKHSCSTVPPLLRQACLSDALNIVCECRVCVQNLSCEATCGTDKNFTFQQHRAYNELIQSVSGTWEQRIATSAVVLDLFTASNMNIHRFTAQKFLQAVYRTCQLVNTRNVTYEATARSSYGEPFEFPTFKNNAPIMFQCL